MCSYQAASKIVKPEAREFTIRRGQTAKRKKLDKAEAKLQGVMDVLNKLQKQFEDQMAGRRPRSYQAKSAPSTPSTRLARQKLARSPRRPRATEAEAKLQGVMDVLQTAEAARTRWPQGTDRSAAGAKNARDKMQQATDLIGGLAGERKRWTEAFAKFIALSKSGFFVEFGRAATRRAAAPSCRTAAPSTRSFGIISWRRS